MKIETISRENRDAVNLFILRQWHSPFMAVRDELVDMRGLEGFLLREKGDILGLITFRPLGDALEIMSLDSLREGQGFGSRLLQAVMDRARASGCGRVLVITTNDNLRAMAFYQKRGFDMIRVRPFAVDRARRLKPEIPLTGENGIPIRHEVEFERTL